MDETWPDEGLQKAKRARYTDQIDDIRSNEYPMLNGTIYLDHAATTPAPASLLSAFSQEFTQNLYGNPHSGSSSSQLSTQRIDDVRLRVLQFFNADPVDFDVVFVANATAGVKLVADAFRDAGEDDGSGFRYTYLRDVHTSVIGVREMAKAGSHCLDDRQDVKHWLDVSQRERMSTLQLFAYHGQSNMNGYRPDPELRWSRRIRHIRETSSQPIYSLFDAAGLVSTSPLNLKDPSSAPDFTVISFYKIFGFPDLGALIVRKASGDILKKRRYFGGGTVDMVIAGVDPWHSKKIDSLHARLEDGTVPFHNIVALDLAMTAHGRIFGSIRDVALHTSLLAEEALKRMSTLRHANGERVCRIYRPDLVRSENRGTFGPIIAFNVMNSNGEWIGKTEVEKLATVKKIQMRTGTLCNPGGTAASLGLTAQDMRENFAKGQRCGDDHDLMDGKPTGVLRISFGAMSNMKDVNDFINFLEEFYVENTASDFQSTNLEPPKSSKFHIASLTVFPIKSCAGYTVPANQRWEIRAEGLAWDREWCLVHQGTGHALSQKRYPRMALLKPDIDLQNSLLTISHSIDGTASNSLKIPMTRHSKSTNLDPTTINICTKTSSSKVCGDLIEIELYTSYLISSFFTEALGVPCALARFPPRAFLASVPPRAMKLKSQLATRVTVLTPPSSGINRSILLSNESPILMISQSSLDRLNEQIQSGRDGTIKPFTKSDEVPAEAFRANMMIAESDTIPSKSNAKPYIEDTWSRLTVSSFQEQAGQEGKLQKRDLRMDVLGPCKRCTMINIDQTQNVTGKTWSEPYSTLAKTRRREGGAWFGIHLSPDLGHGNELGATGDDIVSVGVGDIITPA